MLAAVLLSVFAGAGTFVVMHPDQQSQASVLLVPSVTQPGVVGPTNPLLSLGGSVAVVASVVQLAVSDDDTARTLASAGYTAKYTVLPDLTENAGPVLLITATGTSADTAQSTRDAIVTTIATRLKALQDDRKVPDDLRVSSVVLTSTSQVTTIRKVQIQLAVLVGGSLLAALLLGILLLERRAQALRRGTVRRQGAEISENQAMPTVPHADGVTPPRVRPSHPDASSSSDPVTDQVLDARPERPAGELNPFPDLRVMAGASQDPPPMSRRSGR